MKNAANGGNWLSYKKSKQLKTLVNEVVSPQKGWVEFFQPLLGAGTISGA